MKHICCILLSGLLAWACNEPPIIDCPEAFIQSFNDGTGREIYLTASGIGYLKEDDSCEEIGKVFDPDFEEVYEEIDGKIFRVSDGERFPTRKSFFDDFESYPDFVSMFPKSIADTALIWTSFTLQSPEAPSVSEYVDLRQCILAENCDFKDNRIDLVADPVRTGNQVLRFQSVAANSVSPICKTSMGTDFPYFVKGDQVWFEAEYLIQGAYPVTLVDFENSLFESFPGPRLLTYAGIPSIENKFGFKPIYRQEDPTVTLPLNEWFTIKISLFLSNEEDGQNKVWLNDQLIVDRKGHNLPTYHSIQNSFEIGISATEDACTVFMDNVRVSNMPF